MNSASEKNACLSKIQKVFLLMGTKDIANELTKELSEKNEWQQVEENREQFSQDHERMPGADGEGHHRQLSEDESCVADRHNMDELIFKEKKGAKHNDTTLQWSEG